MNDTVSEWSLYTSNLLRVPLSLKGKNNQSLVGSYCPSVIQCSLQALISFRYNSTDTSPEITPHAPSTFPRTSINNAEIVHQPRFLEFRDIRRLWRKGCARIWLASRLIQIQLQRIAQIPCRKIRCRQSIAYSIYTVRYNRRDGRVALRDEIAPDGHEGFIEVGPLVWGWRTEYG